MEANTWPTDGRLTARAGVALAFFLLVTLPPSRAAGLTDFGSPLGWDGRVIQPDGLYAVTLPRSWTVVPLDETSFHGSAPGEDSLFLYVTVAPRQSATLDGLLDALMKLPKEKMQGFREISRRPFTQDGHEGKTLQAEENDGAWNKIFYTVMFTDTHQYLLRIGCRLDRFPALQPIVKSILGTFSVGAHRTWKRKNTHAIEDPRGRYSAHVPPGWRVEGRADGMKAENADGTTWFSVTVGERRHQSLQEYAADLARTLKKRYPDYRVGSPMNFPEFAGSNQTAKSVTLVTGGPEGDSVARVYAIALSGGNEFLLEGFATGQQGVDVDGAAEMGRLLGLWHAHLRPE